MKTTRNGNISFWVIKGHDKLKNWYQ